MDERGRARGGRDVLGLGQGSDIMTCRFTEDVGPEGDFGGVHFLSEGYADGAEGFVPFGVCMCVRLGLGLGLDVYGTMVRLCVG